MLYETRNAKWMKRTAGHDMSLWMITAHFVWFTSHDPTESQIIGASFEFAKNLAERKLNDSLLETDDKKDNADSTESLDICYFYWGKILYGLFGWIYDWSTGSTNFPFTNKEFTN